MKRLITSIILILAVMGLTSCGSSRPTEYNIAYVIGGGGGDAKAIKEIVMPGEFVNTETDDENQFIYGNARNWNVKVPADGEAEPDVETPWSALSKPFDDGKTPGYVIEGQAITPFAVNRPASKEPCKKNSKEEGCIALFGFYQYCQKYGCTIDPSDDPEKQNLSSDRGWMKMLYEGWAIALSHAFNTVISEYDYTIVNRPADWPTIGKRMGELASAELNQTIGLPNGVSIFCDPSVITGEKCKPPTVQFHSIRSPQAEAILTTRRDKENTTANRLNELANDEKIALEEIAQQSRIQAQRQALAEQRAKDEAALLNQPGYAEAQARRAQIDLVNACAAAGAGKCVIMLGGNSNGTTTQLQVPVG